MASHHYVSKFHLRQFCDLDSTSMRDPWLWVGSFADGTVRKRSPKNVGTISNLFDGPGGLANADAKIESFLANEVEGPASISLREFCDRNNSEALTLPEPLMRYLGWAASRSMV